MTRRKLAALVPIGALLAASWAVRLPYYSEGPGPAKDVEPLIRVTGHQRFASSGHFILTSVLIQSLNVFQAVSAWLDPHRDVVEESAFLAPGETEQQADQRAVSEMDQSKIDATYVALARVAGYPEHHGRGILVEGVGSDCPAAGKLFPGDLIDHVNGRPVTSSRDFERILASIPPDRSVRLAGTAGGERFDVTLVRRPCSGSKQPLVGISSVPAFPFQISISSGDIGGPSAGLMWALGLYDLLTPGDLTGGRIVAGTGVIALDGAVGPIGGVQQKIVAAEQEGAEVFLVPVGNLGEARAARSDLRLVPVKTFGQALHFLRSQG